jgi:hypothetical protein
MADFAQFAEAVGQGLGWPSQTALLDYNDNRHEATIDQLEDSPLAAVLLDLSPDLIQDWSGSPSQLFHELTAIAGDKASSPLWPKSPSQLTIQLRRIAPLLGTQGILVNVLRRHYGRVLSLKRDPSVVRKDAFLSNQKVDDD